MYRLIAFLKKEVASLEIEFINSEQQFADISSKIMECIQFVADKIAGGCSRDKELWFADFRPTMLILDVPRDISPDFSQWTIENKNKIIKWISKRILDIEGISEYGAEHLYMR